MGKKVDYRLDGKILRFDASRTSEHIEFEYPIRQVLEYDGMVFVRLEPGVGIVYNENVFCVSSNGNIVWQVEKINHLEDDSPYTNIVIQDGRLYLYSWGGERMEVGLQDGKIIKKIFMK